MMTTVEDPASGGIINQALFKKLDSITLLLINVFFHVINTFWRKVVSFLLS